MGKADTDRAEHESLPKGGLFVRDFPVLRRFVNVCRRSEPRDREFAASIVSVSHSRNPRTLIPYNANIPFTHLYFINFAKSIFNVCIIIGTSLFVSHVIFGHFMFIQYASLINCKIPSALRRYISAKM